MTFTVFAPESLPVRIHQIHPREKEKAIGWMHAFICIDWQDVGKTDIVRATVNVHHSAVAKGTLLAEAALM